MTVVLQLAPRMSVAQRGLAERGCRLLSGPEELQETGTETRSEPESARIQGDSSCQGPSHPALAMATRREEGPRGLTARCWPRIAPSASLKSLCLLPTPPLVHTGSEALRSRGRDAAAPWPGVAALPPAAPADSPLPSLTLAEGLELFLLPHHEHPGDPWEHRACHGAGGTTPCQRRCQPALWPHALLPRQGSALRPPDARGHDRERAAAAPRTGCPACRCRGWEGARARGSPMSLMAACRRAFCGLSR